MRRRRRRGHGVVRERYAGDEIRRLGIIVRTDNDSTRLELASSPRVASASSSASSILRESAMLITFRKSKSSGNWLGRVSIR